MEKPETQNEFIPSWKELIDLRTGVDKIATIKEIKSKQAMNGANAWMLMCSIVIASIGLNLNSPAIIIGAMLISPLMSPILGIGLSVGINDKALLQKSLKHFGAAILIAVITSSIYFYLSPFQELTIEIESRTSPTFLDVIIAFFGGIAGIISYARKDLSTTIPGVAIATALMPPLCVTGFGLANGYWEIALNAFYLFFLNTLFVTIATYIVIRYLKFPYKKFVNTKEKRRNIVFITSFAIIAIIPSVFIFNRVYNELNTKKNLNSFIENYVGENEIYLDGYKLYQTDSLNKLVLKVYGTNIQSKGLEYYQKGLIQEHLDKTEIVIIPTSEIKVDRVNFLESKISEIEKMASQLEETKKDNLRKQQIVELLEQTVNSTILDSTAFIKLSKEVNLLFPEIESMSMALAQSTNFDQYTQKEPLLMIRWKAKVSKQTQKQQLEKLKEWISLREDIQGLKISILEDNPS
jgi:uncharacterized hydrophobic protein (TIGR00271 family)